MHQHRIVTNGFRTFILMFFLSLLILPPTQASTNRLHTNRNATALCNNDKHQSELVILIHGLMRSPKSMRFLKQFLQQRGYQVYSYGYESTKHSIHEHSLTLTQYLQKILKSHPGKKVHFVTHSLGGIIIRESLGKMSSAQLKNIGYLIMLAPPSQGSKYASNVSRVLPFLPLFIKPLKELRSEPTSYVHHVPIPNVTMGIIAGRYDAKSPPSSAWLAGKNELVVVNAAHTFIMNNAQAREYILAFLSAGTFKTAVGQASG